MGIPRLTMRRLIGAVAIAGVTMGVATMPQRISIRETKASFHATRAAEQRAIVADWRKGEGSGRIFNVTQQEAEAVAEWLDRSIPYHEAMRWKWEEAARYPWLTVEPDPPEPEP